MSAPASQGEGTAAAGSAPTAWLRLRHTLATRKWIVWAIAVLLLVAAVQLAVLLLPHNALHSLQSVEEKASGVQEQPQGVRQVSSTGSR